MRHVRSSFSRPVRCFASISSLIVLAGVLGWIDTSRDASPPPISRIASENSCVNVQKCAECHAGIVADFATAPHSNTLRPGTDEDILALFAGQSVQQGGRTFSFTMDGHDLWFGSDDLEYQRRVDWVFGSGRHALTPVSLDPDGITQLSISYYADGEFRSTPGVSENRLGFAQLGAHESEADARRCFGCHVSRMSDDSLSNMKVDLDCSRCHFGADEHARSGGDRSPQPSWHELTPLESVNRCGECHRRADERKPDEISTDETHLIRFAPVGLVTSRCFEVANAPENAGIYPRLDCVTCHDPHLPSKTDPTYFEAICRSCHTPSQTHATVTHGLDTPDPAATNGGASADRGNRFVACSAEPPESACLSCHMPKTDFAPGLRFTDHWIR